MVRLELPRPVRLLATVWEAPGVKRLTLSLPEQWVGHQPGQFVMVSVYGVGEIPLSISSPPAESDQLELCVRQVGEVTTQLLRLSPGAVLGLRGPLGHGFPLQPFLDHPAIVVAGGMGIVPLRALVEQLLSVERSPECSISVYLGARREEDLVYLTRLAMWGQCSVQVRTVVEQPSPTWSGAVGRVTDLLTPGLADARVAVVGPPAMYLPTIRRLLSLSVAPEHIWVSLERRMACGIGQCGHCQAGKLCICLQGPVFCYADIADVKEAW